MNNNGVIVRLILTGGADGNAQDENGGTALIFGKI
jgi:hypothetical protein